MMKLKRLILSLKWWIISLINNKHTQVICNTNNIIKDKHSNSKIEIEYLICNNNTDVETISHNLSKEHKTNKLTGTEIIQQITNHTLIQMLTMVEWPRNNNKTFSNNSKECQVTNMECLVVSMNKIIKGSL